MAGSIAPTVKAALVTKLQGLAEFASPVAVTYGYSGKVEASTKDYVYVGKTGGPKQYSAMTSGTKPRDEHPTIEVIFRSVVNGGTPSDAEARLFVLADAMEVALAADTNLGGVSGLRWIGITSFEVDTSVDDSAAYAYGTWTLTYSARNF